MQMNPRLERQHLDDSAAELANKKWLPGQQMMMKMMAKLGIYSPPASHYHIYFPPALDSPPPLQTTKYLPGK